MPIPRLTTCVRDDDGCLWCWDDDSQSIVQVVINKDTPVPKKVINSLIAVLIKEANNV